MTDDTETGETENMATQTGGMFPGLDLDAAKEFKRKAQEETAKIMDRAGIPNQPGEKPYGAFLFTIRLGGLLLLISVGVFIGIFAHVKWEERTGVNSFSIVARDLYGSGRQEEGKIFQEMGNICPDRMNAPYACTLLEEALKKTDSKPKK